MQEMTVCKHITGSEEGRKGQSSWNLVLVATLLPFMTSLSIYVPTLIMSNSEHTRMKMEMGQSGG